MLFVIVELFENLEDFSRAEVPVAMIVKYYGAFLSSGFEYIAPVSLLLATLYSMQQMTKSNELIAMRASGISLQRIVLPLVLAGILFGLLLSIDQGTGRSPRQWIGRRVLRKN